MICCKCHTHYVKPSDPETAAQHRCPECLETPEEKLHAAACQFVTSTGGFTHSERLYGLSKWYFGYQKFLQDITGPMDTLQEKQQQKADDEGAKNMGYIAMSLESLAHDMKLLEDGK